MKTEKAAEVPLALGHYLMSIVKTSELTRVATVTQRPTYPSAQTGHFLFLDYSRHGIYLQLRLIGGNCYSNPIFRDAYEVCAGGWDAQNPPKAQNSTARHLLPADGRYARGYYLEWWKYLQKAGSTVTMSVLLTLLNAIGRSLGHF